jgi:hypothetical protein
MSSPTHELQVAIVTRLKASAAITALVGQRVFDHVPAEAAWPYVSIGPSYELSEDADCIDAFEISQQIDVWSQDVGYPEARRIADAVRQALKADLILADNALVSFEHRITRYLRDPNPLVSRASLTFDAIVEQP